MYKNFRYVADEVFIQMGRVKKECLRQTTHVKYE